LAAGFTAVGVATSCRHVQLLQHAMHGWEAGLFQLHKAQRLRQQQLLV
jgi:hypothetical protein